MSNYVLIMAGGIGSRFWPRSTEKTPKHLLKIFNDKNMLQNTIDRVEKLTTKEKVFVISNFSQAKLLLQETNLLKENLICEPFGRNTAAAIGYGALHFSLLDEDASMVVLPADHYIRENDKFKNIIELGLAEIEKCPSHLVTIGIAPTYPATGYGYIQIGEKLSDKIYRVKTFAEKPDLKTAEKFISSKVFYWNSGIFIWKAKTILKMIEKHIPDLYESLMKIKETIVNKKEISVIERIYKDMKSISIDYGVMEKAENIKVILGDFNWSDVGSWKEVYRFKEDKADKKGNVIEANKPN